jgi:hypothetical protein
MAKRVQLIRHASAGANSFLGKEGELTINLTTGSIRVHDGLNVGGTETARSDLTNVSNATNAGAGKMSAAAVMELEAATSSIANLGTSSAFDVGSGNGLDADLLDGLEGSAYTLQGHTHVFADITDPIDAASLEGLTADAFANLNSGTVTDANISESSVTQHEGAINHDSLSNVPADDHLNWKVDQGGNNIHVDNVPTAQDALKWNGAVQTVTTSGPTGGSNGDMHFQYTP